MTRLRRRNAIQSSKQILVGSYGLRALSPLKPGQERCPACQQGASVTSSGRLHAHRDADGLDCPQRLRDGTPVHLDEVPAVALPEKRTGRCHTCDRPVSGERHYCGPCLSKRGSL